ncbi:MAG: hypothetical protein U0354_14190 [Candidatus Sericytochromatia bacterium]
MNDLKETWNYQIFLKEYNNIAKIRNGFNYILDEIDYLEEHYNESSCKKIKEYANAVYWHEQLLDTISAKYTGSIIPSESHSWYLDDE